MSDHDLEKDNEHDETHDAQENDGFEQSDDLEGLQETSSVKDNLKSAFSDGKTKLLLGVSLVAILGIVGVFTLSGGEEATQSSVVRPPQVRASDDMRPVNPEYAKVAKIESNQRIAEAEKNNQSGVASAIVVDKPVQQAFDIDANDDYDLSRFADLEPPKPRRVQNIAPPQPAVVSKPAVRDMPTLDYSRGLSMVDQMEADVMPASPVSFRLRSRPSTDNTTGQQALAAVTEQDLADNGFSRADLPAPGEILLARLTTDADNYENGPVLATVLHGKLKGMRLIGSFTETEGNKLIITFNRVIESFEKDYREGSIQSIAVHPETAKLGQATDVDRRLGLRFGVAFLASFIKGFGEAMGRGDQETIVNGNSTIQVVKEITTGEAIFAGAGEAAGTVAEQIINETSAIRTHVTVERGTIVGVLFL